MSAWYICIPMAIVGGVAFVVAVHILRRVLDRMSVEINEEY